MKRNISLALLLLLLTLTVQSAEVNNLYQTEVPVASQAPADRNEAIGQAFLQVLIKVTGNRNIANQQKLRPEFAKASRYVQQYRYRLEEVDVAQPDTANPVETETLPESKRYLQITFDRLAVNQMLRKIGLPVWGKSRPQVLAWVGFEKNGNRSLLNPERDTVTPGLLTAKADRRGIPLMIPLMDLEDQGRISASELWGSFQQRVQDASQRYLPDVVLTVKVRSASKGHWDSQWSLIGSNENREWQINADSLVQVYSEGIDRLSDQLARIYAPAGGDQTQSLNMQISAVQSFDDLVKIQNFMATQETVQAFHIRAINSDQVILSLNLQGGLQAFEQAISLSGLLVEDQGELIRPEQPLNVPTVVTQLPDTQEPLQGQEPVQPGTVQQAQSMAPIESQTPESIEPTLARQFVDDIQLYYQLR